LRVLRMRYTESHPDVQDTKRLLELAQAEAAQTSGVEGGPGAGRTKIVGRNANPVHERLRAQIGEEDAKIAALETRLERNNTEVTRWEDRVKSIPTVGAELARLTRDYDVIKRNYEELIARRESAKLGQKLEAQSKTLQFRIVDPPDVPIIPSGPNRVLFVSVIFAVGLAAGLFFAFFMGQIDNSIVHLAQLRAVANLPVLGSISTMITDAERWRRKVEATTYGVVCIALVGAFAGLLTIELLLNRGGA
jgi:polysaccharide chain length determinant protein (PEP-CTERM system associated)